MNKWGRASAVRLLFAVFLMLMCFNIGSLNASATVKDNSGKVLISKADYIKITINKTYLQGQSDCEYYNYGNYGRGYAMDLELSNKTKKPVFVNLFITKVNGKHISLDGIPITGRIEELRTATLTGTSIIRMNKGATIKRTALIPSTTLADNKVNKVKNIDGYVKITDTKGKVLLDSKKGSFHADLENDSSDDILSFDLQTGVTFDSSDKKSIKGNVSFCVTKFFPGDNQDYSIEFDYQNTTKTDYKLSATFADGTEFIKTTLTKSKTDIDILQVRQNPAPKTDEAYKKAATLPITFKLLSKADETVIAKKTIDFNFGKIPKYVSGMNSLYLNFVDMDGRSYSSIYLGQNPGRCVIKPFSSNNDSESVPGNKITWISSETDIVTVDSSGNLTLKGKAGCSIITGKYGTELYQSLMEVKEPEIKISPITVPVGEFKQIDCEVLPGEDGDSYVKFTSSDEDIFYPYGGCIYGNKEGVAKLKATLCQNGKETNVTKEILVRITKAVDNSKKTPKQTQVITVSAPIAGKSFTKDKAFSIGVGSLKASENGYYLLMTEKNLGNKLA